MASKALSIILLGLALCCFLQSTAAQDKACSLNFTDSTKYWGFVEGEGNHTYIFSGWYMKGKVNKTQKLYSLQSVKPSHCELCTLAVFKTDKFGGTSKLYDFRDASVYQPQITFPFLVKSYTLKCFKEEPEEDIDRSGEFPNVEWRQMSENEDLPLPSNIVQLRGKAVNRAVKRMKAKGILSEGQYTITQIFATEFSANYDILYRFTVQVTSDSGVQYKISATVFTAIDDLQNYEFISYAYFEHRLGEFTDPDWGQMNEDEDLPLPDDVVQLRSKAVKQAVGRMKAQRILPEGEYTITQTFPTDFNLRIDHPEFSYDNVIHRFNVQVTNQASGVRFRIQAVTISRDGTPSYELIDYAYFEHRLGEFTDPDWGQMNEDEDLPLPDDVVQLRAKAVSQAVERMKVKGILPEGQYVMTQTFPTDFNLRIDHPEYPSYDNVIHRFNIQVTNQASGVRFRIQAATISRDGTPGYELIDYAYIENRLGEFENPDWGQMNEDEDLPLPDDVVQLRAKAVSQAVERMKVKGILPEGQYVMTQTFPTDFNLRIDHPEFSYDNVIHRFNVQVTNQASRVRFRIQAVTISSDGTPGYELIDYAYIENRLGEFSNVVFRGINEEELRGRAIKQAVERLQAKGVLPEGQYVVTKILQTEFSAGYEHSEFPLENGDVLWKFNVEISTGVRVFAVALTNYATPLAYELVDYGKTQ